jgi:hypothetical protein
VGVAIVAASRHRTALKLADRDAAVLFAGMSPGSTLSVGP